jgi:hypothetical protein
MWPRTATKGSNRQIRSSVLLGNIEGGFVISNSHHQATLLVHVLYVGSRDGNAFPDADRKAVIDAASASFSCFTVVDVDGYFKGRSVATLIIKIATNDTASLEMLGCDLGRLLGQEAIGLETAGTYRSISMD